MRVETLGTAAMISEPYVVAFRTPSGRVAEQLVVDSQSGVFRGIPPKYYFPVVNPAGWKLWYGLQCLLR